ncbi:MAG TPA: SDR family oxidoreductase [Amnibacterium sp.]|jgi:NAD(P)-dependent dehydrogenase (short-subunit alcohol dehydrogenase family)|nr:SDR family oxidoreductase [Amnibacterium sp.]
MSVVVVTGGGRGIGAAVCRRLAADGADVVVGYRRDRDAAERVAAEVRAAGRRAIAVAADVTDEAEVEALLAAAGGLGPVTGLVTSAGAATAVGRLEDLPVAALRADLELDLLGTLLPIRAAIPRLREAGGGAIVTVSSGAATLGSPGEFVHYAAAKAGVDTLTVGLSKELAADGIRVNAVAPGLVRTGFHRDPGRPDRLVPTVPMQRAGEPEEIAAAVSWLLSSDASYTTGAILRVAGGR